MSVLMNFSLLQYGQVVLLHFVPHCHCRIVFSFILTAEVVSIKQA